MITLRWRLIWRKAVHRHKLKKLSQKNKFRKFELKIFYMPTQFLTDKSGKKVSAVIPLKDYERMLDEIDELNCIKAYDKGKTGRKQFVPANVAFKEVERKRKIKKNV